MWQLHADSPFPLLSSSKYLAFNFSLNLGHFESFIFIFLRVDYSLPVQRKTKAVIVHSQK